MIREATVEDTDAIFALAEAFVRMCPWIPQGIDHASTVALFRGLVVAEQGVVLVAVDLAGAVVGMLAGVCAPAPFDQQHLLAQELAWYVREDARQANHGGELYHAFLAWAQAQGAQSVSMAVVQTSQPSVVAYLQSQGFQQAETAYIRRL